MGFGFSGILLWTLSALGVCVESNPIDSSDSFSPIEVTILSSNGTDLTPSVPILHSTVPISTLQKRALTYTAVRNCPSHDQTISHSWCQHDVTPRSFNTFCHEPSQSGRAGNNMYYRQGTCDPDELCVGSETGEGSEPLQAYCVPATYFAPIGQKASHQNDQKPDSTGVVTAGFNAALHSRNGSVLAVEAMVTSADGRKSVFATSIVIQAQKRSGSLWLPVANGSSSGREYPSLSLAPFPATAQRVKVDVVMPDWAPTGLLWLASYLYEDQ